MTVKIDHIVFDIGRVLIHYDPEIPFRRLIPDGDRRRHFLTHVCNHDWNIEQDRGRGWDEAEALALSANPDFVNEIPLFRRHWREMVSHAYDGTVAILESLIAGGRDVTMLTNFASDTFREAQVMYPFLTISRGVTVSGDIRAIKPERAIYDHHADAFGLEPARTLFIDDSVKNVEGAIAAGWQAVHFTDSEKLARDLRSLGLTY
ncbi:MAG TPA: HAD family phosphatase [Rhizobiaceae bacterium]|nr:HAD family phosphatase [Rhizobiaceae bacterium]